MRELDFARRIAVKAGLMLKKNQSGRRSVRFKAGAGNLVTDMDHASEEMIVTALRREFPDHAIMAEERGRRATPRTAGTSIPSTAPPTTPTDSRCGR